MDQGNPVEKFAGAASFQKMTNLLIDDQEQGLQVYEGEIFEAKTVKGNTNLIVAMRVSFDGWLYYIHGEKVKKVRIETFVSSVLHGDLEPKHPKECDVGRLSMATIAIDAIANRRTVEEHIDILGDEAYRREHSQG